MVGLRRPLRRQRPMQPLLVHVLAHSCRLSPSPTRGKQSRLPPNRRDRPTPRPASLHRQSSRRLVPANSARSLAATRPRTPPQTNRHSPRLVYLLLLHPHRLPQKRRDLRAHHRRIASSKGSPCPALEAYSLDADKTPSTSSTGYATTFVRAGFEVIVSHTPPRPIMRHNLKSITPPSKKR
jgi:hypothetical protein